MSIRPFVLVLFFCIFAVSGCSSLHTVRKPDLSVFLPPGPVDRAVAAWNPSLETGEQPKRGFGGRVYFYDAEARRPIKIDGAIAVYAFDETNRQPNDNEPTRVYSFAKEDLPKCYSKSKLGHSYNLWIPWDTEGPDGEAKKVSFIVRYIPEKGSSVISSQVTAYLAGRMNKNEMLAKNTNQNDNQNIQINTTNNNIQQTSFTETSDFIDSMRNEIQNSTITQPEKLKQTDSIEHLIETNDNRPKKMQTITIK
ncbi:MAG: hypothetical protein LBQ66_03605 [Planctomycetaceae bacterium]|jgi:hypothetical protein|nr:hypothetical protein [Planctomycetaceae bacterium]